MRGHNRVQYSQCRQPKHYAVYNVQRTGGIIHDFSPSKKVVQDKSGTHAFSDRVGQYGMTFIICISKSRTRGLFPVKFKKGSSR